MNKKQIPRGPEGLKCPMHRKPMSEVCHTCPWWVMLGKKDAAPEWDCAVAWAPQLIINAAQESNHTAASVDKLATEVKAASTDSTANIGVLMGLLNRAAGQSPAVALQDDRQMPLRLEN